MSSNGTIRTVALLVAFVLSLGRMSGTASPPSEGTTVLGGGIPAGLDLPVGEPIYARPVREVIATEGGGLLPLSYGGDPYKPIGTIAGGVCQFDFQCDDCNPCTVDTCDLQAGSAFGTCSNLPADVCTSCDDGFYCNGHDRCNTHGECVPEGVDPCALNPFAICNEDGGFYGTGGCDAICTSDFECPDNGDFCDGTEFCDLMECVGGISPPPGTPCTSDANCDSANGGYCGGVCRHSGNPCAEGAICYEPGDSCGNGRCCREDGANPGEYLCTREPKIDCEAGGGTWLGIGDFAETVYDDADCSVEGPYSVNAGEDTRCPAYASGLAEGEQLASVGPIGIATCNAAWELGDDYAVSNASPSFAFRARTLRLVWGWETVGIQGDPSRIRITFYDENGAFVEDFISDSASGPREPSLRTVIFPEPPIIPSTGFVTIQAASRYAPYGRHYWMSTGAVDVGTNDPDVLWVNGAAADASQLGGEPGVLSFELVGEKVPTPLGACCDNDTGECTRVPPWTCEAGGNLFQGIGVFCRWCSTPFPLRACETDADCRYCIGGTSPGEVCTVDADCAEGGSCGGTDTCVDVPPACQISACCNPTDGACDTVQGGLCEDETTPCIADADCAAIGGGTCNARCDLAYGPGWISQGFGTSCDPNCCEQPTQSGGDTCDTATVHSIAVPPVGDYPVTWTITGDNSSATFGDFVGDGSGTCEVDLHDPAVLEDRGWWEAFNIDACAYVRLDYCCTESLTGEAKEPQWAFLRDACDPCDREIHPSPLPPPIGNELAGTANGDPFCDGNDPWQTYGPLPAGTYYHNVYSAPDGTFGLYQMHLTVEACPERACCLPEPMCVGGSNEHVLFDGSGLAIPCAGDGDCPAGGVCRTCAVVNELDCEAADGFWNGFGDLPDGTDPIVSCAGAPCDIGSCCLDLGVCDDRADAGTPCDPAQPLTCMSRSQCEGAGGTFSGGERCDFPAWPCPTCAVQGASNCQYPPNLWTEPSDLALPPNGAVSADDFIPQGDTVETVCVWGAYTHEIHSSSETLNCIDEYGPDDFRVRIYADGGGLPGTLVGERRVNGANVTRVPEPGTPWEDTWIDPIVSQAHNLVLDPPITGLVPGERYWLEVANGADRVSPESRLTGNTCVWNWHQYEAQDGRDEFSARGTDDRSIDGAPPVPGSGYILGSGHHIDRAFCLGISQSEPLPFAPGPEQVGACYSCETEACTPLTQVDCVDAAGVWKQDDPTCTWPFMLQDGEICGVFPGAIAGSVCVGGVPDGVLDPGEECDDGDDTDPFDGCDGCLLECFPSPVYAGPVILPEDGLYAFNTTCSTTDGPEYVSDRQDRQSRFGRDIWFEYTTTVTGQMFASLCPTGNAADRDNGYDAWIALYHDDENPRACPCPYPSGLPIDESDEGCNGLSDQGPGLVSRLVVPDECYLIRVGGWQSYFGQGLLDVATVVDPCYLEPANPPVLETITDGTGAEFVSAKNRFLSFTNENNVGRTQGVRVTFVELPPPYDIWNGAQLWVGQPYDVSENGGTVDPVPGFSNFWAAPLVCDPASAHYADWEAEYGTVHVFHEGIVPGGLYELQVVDEVCGPSGVFSPPAIVVNPEWGDTVGDFDVGLGLWTAPDASVDVATDVVAALDKFGSAATAPTKARVDVEPALIDFIINITDVTLILDAFAGAGYPFAPSGSMPCP